MGKKNDEKLSKKQLRKIAEKAERKAAEKAARKKSKKKDAGKTEQHPHLDHLDRVERLQKIADDDTAKKSARKEARAELKKLRAEGEALNAKRDAARDAAKDLDEAIDARMSGGKSSSTEERTRKMQHDVAEKNGWPTPDEAEKIKADGLLALPVDEAQPAKDEPATDDSDDDGKSIAAAAEAATPTDIAAPSDAPKRWEDDVNGLGQYKVQEPNTEKIRGYTRVTTYIDTLEDKSTLTKWKMRILLEGVAAVDTPTDDEPGRGPTVTERVRALVTERDSAIEKARKSDRKGKLVPGQLATITDGVWGDFKRALDALADEVFEVGGGREKAQKGTDIHALCELADAEGIDAVQDKLDAGEISPSDFADVSAYVEAIRKMGLKVVAQEQVVVNDDLRVAGRLDRIYMGRLPEIRHPKTGEIIRPADRIARRYVADIKTGRVDFGQGKIAQQIRMYADGTAYDPDTHERTAHRANRSIGLLVHLPAGTGKCTIHPVDLTVGDKGNKLSAQVRQFRNEGRRAIELKTDLAAIDATDGDE